MRILCLFNICEILPSFVVTFDGFEDKLQLFIEISPLQFEWELLDFSSKIIISEEGRQPLFLFLISWFLLGKLLILIELILSLLVDVCRYIESRRKQMAVLHSANIVPSSEQVGFTFFTGRLLDKDAEPDSKVVLATLLGCVPSHSRASWENNWMAWAAAWFGVRFVIYTKNNKLIFIR